jgi:hypothetical protein
MRASDSGSLCPTPLVSAVGVTIAAPKRLTPRTWGSVAEVVVVPIEAVYVHPVGFTVAPVVLIPVVGSCEDLDRAWCPAFSRGEGIWSTGWFSPRYTVMWPAGQSASNTFLPIVLILAGLNRFGWTLRPALWGHSP